MPSSAENLSKYLRNPKRSGEREQMLEHWFLTEVYRVAATYNRVPMVYRTEQDRGGFDVAVGIDHRFRELQLKVVIRGGKRQKWEVHRSMLRPKIDYLERFGFLAEGLAAGRMGGIVLMDVDVTESAALDVRLSYCDVYTLSFQDLRSTTRDRQGAKLLQELRTQSYSSKPVPLRRQNFLPMASAEHLLIFAGLIDGAGPIPQALMNEALRIRHRNGRGDSFENPEKTIQGHVRVLERWLNAPIDDSPNLARK